MDIVFLTLPRLELRAPITAPAILKAMAERHGYSAFCFDLNLDLWESVDVGTHGHVWFDTDLTFRYKDKFEEFWNAVIAPVSKNWVERLQEICPRYIGITIFSQRSVWITYKICELLRDNLPQCKVIVGGPYGHVTGPSLYEKNLIHAYVTGEGELPLVEILRDNLDFPGINGRPPKQIDDLSIVPIPDYSDFKIDRYPRTWNDPRIRGDNERGTEFIYITGSRGCVRKCDFCDIASIWPKFRYRSGQSIAEEMMQQNRKHGSKKFLFTDSLINGSVKQLEDLCRTLISYRDQKLMQPVRWQGQFICRPEAQMPEDIYRLMKDAGCFFVSIGVESGSEKVRHDMDKMFDDKAMDFTFKMCAKHGIEMAWLLLVGYPTETEAEFIKTLDMLETYNWINQKKLIRSVALGPTLDIVPGSPLYARQEKMGITSDSNGHWVYQHNTREVRIRRWLRLREKCAELNYPIVEKAKEHLMNELEELVGKNQKVLEPQIYDHYNERLGAMGPSL